MIKLIKAQNRHYNDFRWLTTYWLFSFSNYYDPENVSHGALRVFNDDIVQPGTGFDTHPHEEMEIISIVLEGEMVHRDSMGNELIIKEGDVQRMTAGTGLQHSEWNRGNTPVAFFQIWIYPDKTGLAPSYDQKNFQSDNWQNRLTLVASGNHSANVVSLNTDADLYRATAINGYSETYETSNNRAVFIYIIEGGVLVNNVEANMRDQVRICNETDITICARGASDFILIDVPLTNKKMR